jgi:hypothetical protein
MTDKSEGSRIKTETIASPEALLKSIYAPAVRHLVPETIEEAIVIHKAELAQRRRKTERNKRKRERRAAR